MGLSVPFLRPKSMEAGTIDGWLWGIPRAMGIAPVEPPGTRVGPAELARPPSSNHDGQAWQVSPGGQARCLRERAAGLTWRGHWSGLPGRDGREAEMAVVGCWGGKVREEFGEFVRVGMGRLDDGGAQRGLERHRKIAGVTKSSRIKLVEPVTWAGLNGQWAGVTKAGAFLFVFLKKDGNRTFDEGRILQAEELTANR